MKIRSKALSEQLAELPPSHVYQYTSPSGLIGILKSEEVWATNIRYLNDLNELHEASNAAEKILEEMLSNEHSPESVLLGKMHENVGTVASRYYVASFSEDGDSLSQWRAYSPQTGGYALGVPSAHLASLALESEGWIFAKCVYDQELRDRIIQEVIEDFLIEYRQGLIDENDLSENDGLAAFQNKIALNFKNYISRIGGIIKNKAFKDEKEWRIISPSIIEDDERLEFREGASSVVPYYRFSLIKADDSDLTDYKNDEWKLVVGPTPQMNNEAKQAAQYILTKYLGTSKGHKLSEIPYKSY